MPRVFRQQYTRPIPADAVHVTMTTKKGEEVPAVRFRGPDGKTITAPVTTKGANAGKLCRVASPTWYGKVNGVSIPLCSNKAASEIMLGEKMKQAAMGQAGAVDPHKEHRVRPLVDHLAAFQAELAAGLIGDKKKRRRRKPGNKHVSATLYRIRTILIDACGFRTLGEINCVSVQEQLDKITLDDAPSAIPPPENPAGYTKRELHAHLGLSIRSIGVLVTRLGLSANGNGKARRFPIETALVLVSRRGRGVGEGTAGAYARDLRCFGRWLVRRKRVSPDANELADLAGTPAPDHRHDRRPLAVEDLRRLLDATLSSSRTVKKLPPRDRWALYLTAMSTGFRAGELSLLCRRRFQLAGDVPVVVLTENETKNGQAVHQPVHSAVAEALAPWLADKPMDQPLWPGRWVAKPVHVLRKDLDASSIPYTVPGPDGRPLYADFHALRHSFIAALDHSGSSLKEAMQLARHSDPRLTMAVYGRAQLLDLAGAVNRLPDFTSPPNSQQTAHATGTDGAIPDTAGRKFPYTLLTQEGDGERCGAMAGDGGSPEASSMNACHNPLPGNSFDTEKGRLIGSDESAPRRTRTYNPLIKSQLLCQLS